MDCKQAQQLFDAYLDGELSPGLATELGAHRLKCPQCRRALALMEVSGHVVASDRDPVSLSGDFSDRLVACIEPKASRRMVRLRRSLYVAGPLAAAAVVALALVGVFDGPEPKILGNTERMDPEAARQLHEPAPKGDVPQTAESPGSAEEQLLQEWIEETQKNIAAKRESGESLQKALDLTVLQLLDILNQANDASSDEDHFPGADVSAPDAPPKLDPSDSEDVEDL